MRKVKSYSIVVILFFLIIGCSEKSEIEKYGQHYQEHNDYQSLNMVVELMNLGADTTYVKKILGEPINMGFDYRYLLDSIGPKGCHIGAVFHITDGKIDDKWLDEICE